MIWHFNVSWIIWDSRNLVLAHLYGQKVIWPDLESIGGLRGLCPPLGRKILPKNVIFAIWGLQPNHHHPFPEQMLKLMWEAPFAKFSRSVCEIWEIFQFELLKDLHATSVFPFPNANEKECTSALRFLVHGFV